MSNPNFVRASYDVPTRSVQFETDDGRMLVRSGGSLCWRTNNCGNLSSPVDVKTNKPAPKRTQNWIGFAEVNNPEQHFFFIFPNYEEGRAQLKASLQRKYADYTLAATVDKYADKKDAANDTTRYLAFLKDKTGLGSETVIKTLSPGQLNTLLDAIEAMEGYHADKASQKEQWLTVSRYSASDGAAPIPGAQVHVEYKGHTFPVHADEHGIFPHLPHPPAGQSPTKVKVLQPNGLWKTLVELAHGTPPKTGVFVLDMLVMTAQTLGHTAPKNAKDNKIPAHYRVQPGDSLQSIATKFRSTTADIQTLNHLSEFSVHPEQMLWIHGKGFEIDRAKAKSADKAQAQKAIEGHAKKTKAEAKAKQQANSKPNEAGSTNESAKKEEPDFWDQFKTWVSPTQVHYARSKDGEGAPLALFDPGDKRAPWMRVAFKEAKDWAGQKEEDIEKTHNIHELVGAHKKMSVTPWCASFVNYCLKTSEPAYPMAHNPLGSFSICESPDRFVEVKKPVYGAIRFCRRDGGSGHVCFVVGKLGNELVVLGGNQGNQIRIEIPEAKTNKSQRFFVPIAYKEFSEKEQEKELSEVDVVALKQYFGNAVSPGLKPSQSLQ